MRSPSPRSTTTRNLADPFTVEQWIAARTEPSIRAVGWTPERDLHGDYAAWAKAEDHPREVILCEELFAESLNHHRIDRQRRLVQRDNAAPAYEPCRAIKLLAPIRVAA